MGNLMGVMDGVVFDANTVPESENSFEPLPAGIYDVQIVESDVKETKAGNGHYIKLTLEVLSGPFEGRKLWPQINIRNANPLAQQIGLRDFADLCLACNKPEVQDTEELHFIPFKVKLKVKKDEQYGDKNEVGKYMGAGGAPASGPPPRSPPPGPPRRQPERRARSPGSDREAGRAAYRGKLSRRPSPAITTFEDAATAAKALPCPPFRIPIPHTAAAIDEVRAKRSPPPDWGNVPVSKLATACDREIWYRLRWAAQERPKAGRFRALADIGNHRETALLADLAATGADVHGHQGAVTLANGWIRGKIDALVTGLPEAPKTPHVVETKSMQASDWRAVVKHGVAKAMPEHWAQVQAYMAATRTTRALYLIENRDTGEVHTERVEADPAWALRTEARVARIATASEPPSRNEGFWCDWCPALAICKAGAFARRNCRTCLFADLAPEGTDLPEARGEALVGGAAAGLPPIIATCPRSCPATKWTSRARRSCTRSPPGNGATKGGRHERAGLLPGSDRPKARRVRSSWV